MFRTFLALIAVTAIASAAHAQAAAKPTDKMPVPPGYKAEAKEHHHDAPVTYAAPGCPTGQCARPGAFVASLPLMNAIHGRLEEIEANKPVRTWLAGRPVRTFFKNHRPHILFKGGCGG